MERSMDQPQSRQLSIALVQYPWSRKECSMRRAMPVPGGCSYSSSGGDSPTNKTFCDAVMTRPHNDEDKLPGQLQRRCVLESRDAGPVNFIASLGQSLPKLDSAKLVQRESSGNQ